MKKFVAQLLLFILPLLIIPGIPTFIVWKMKENFYSIDGLIKSDKKYMIGYTNEKNYDYLKWAHINLNEKKTVWALGSSRVLQFREYMFDATFYNAGYTIRSITDFRSFLKSLPKEKYPDHMIIGLDQWMFNRAFDSLTKTIPVDEWENSFSYLPEFTTKYRLVYDELFKGSYKTDHFRQNDSVYAVGENAFQSRIGFRKDGSIYYGGLIDKLLTHDKSFYDFEFALTYSFIDNGTRRFEYQDAVNIYALVELQQLLTYCKEHHIKVTGFFPPYPEKVYDKMMGTGKYGYLKKLRRTVKPFFDANGYEVFDFTNVAWCGSNEFEMIDGTHGSELTYQKILISMVDSGSVLKRFVDTKRLRKDLLRKQNNYIIYPF